ncbi:MAG: hypothetical protein RL560_822, partial [Actinomycetota bacterium]
RLNQRQLIRRRFETSASSPISITANQRWQIACSKLPKSSKRAICARNISIVWISNANAASPLNPKLCVFRGTWTLPMKFRARSLRVKAPFSLWIALKESKRKLWQISILLWRTTSPLFRCSTRLIFQMRSPINLQQNSLDSSVAKSAMYYVSLEKLEMALQIYWIKSLRRFQLQ